MIGAAQRDSNLKVILRYEADNAKRFPKDAEAWEVYGGTLFRAGELQQALEAGKHAVAVDPKIPDGFGFVFTVYRRLNWPDSAVAYAKQALKAGADSTLIGQQMVSVIGPYAQKADSLTHTEDPGAKAAWQSVFDVALKIDSVVPGTPTKYFMGLAAAQMGLIGLKHVQQLGDLAKTNKAEACRQMTEIDDLLTSARVNITAGGSFDKAAAGSIMTLVMTDQPQLQAYKASICK
jgi:tetratricopeptide (TPR) repeat protein